jgi:cell wall-associated NlpC family hydrolase
VRVHRLIIPSLAVFAFAGTTDALAAGGAGSSSGSSTPSSSGASGAAAPAPTVTANTGGVGLGVPAPPVSTPAHPSVAGATAKIINGVAYAPSYAPIQVQRAIWAGNRIRHKPYIWGGGHASFKSAGYDCSGSVSYVLHAAGLLTTPDDSSGFFAWGKHGLGRWITVYTNAGHAFVEIAGIRLDTSSQGDPHPAKGSGPRWRPLLADTSGFLPRHALGY